MTRKKASKKSAKRKRATSKRKRATSKRKRATSKRKSATAKRKRASRKRVQARSKFDNSRLDEYQGADKFFANHYVRWKWVPIDEDAKEPTKEGRYFLVSLKGKDKQEVRGVSYTYFAAEGNYPRLSVPKDRFSSNHFMKRLFLSTDEKPSNKIRGADWQGRVPQEVLIDSVNRVLGLKRKGLDFREVYESWSMVYEIGEYVYYWTKTGRHAHRSVIRRIEDGRGRI